MQIWSRNDLDWRREGDTPVLRCAEEESHPGPKHVGSRALKGKQVTGPFGHEPYEVTGYEPFGVTGYKPIEVTC